MIGFRLLVVGLFFSWALVAFAQTSDSQDEKSEIGEENEDSETNEDAGGSEPLTESLGGSNEEDGLNQGGTQDIATKPQAIPLENKQVRPDSVNRPQFNRVEFSKLRSPMMIDRSVLNSVILENIPVLSQARKTGKLGGESIQLAKFGLGKEQTLRFFRMSPKVRSEMLGSRITEVRRILAMDGFENEQALLFYEYQPKTRSLILGLEDEVLVPLLNEEIEEDLLVESLSKMNLGSASPAKLPKFTPGTKFDERAMALSIRLMEEGNGEVFGKLNELSNGEWTQDILRIGEVADILLRDYDLQSSLPSERLSTTEALENPFFAEVTALYEELKFDGFVDGTGGIIGGNDLIVRGNANALQPYINNGSEELIVAASNLLSITADVDWNLKSEEDVRVVLMTPGNLSIEPGSSIRTATADLVLATQENLLINQVSFRAPREITVRGFRDVTLNDVSMSAGTLARIKARRDLNVDGLSFNQDISRIVMEATTMRLKNVTFPATALVRLNSLKGGVDGRYPNFGTGIPAADQIGRVNFIENVRYGANVLNDRASFDLHGQNIEIGKIARP